MAAQLLVSIGLPVFNGEAYLRQALDSLLAQTYTTFEIVLVDNASTDTTQSICQEYAKIDRRVKYFRNSSNIGAAGNYNRAFAESSGEYFKWAAHDDILHPQYLEKCVEQLNSDPAIVLCHARTGQIDENGKIQAHEYVKPADVLPRALTPSKRFRSLIQDRGSWTRIFGVLRRDVIENTPLIDYYTGSDLTLLGEIGMRGEVVDLNDVLFWRREHGNTSTQGEFRPRRKRLVWFSSSKRAGMNFPEWKLNAMLMRSLSRQPLSLSEKLWCAGYVFERCWKKKKLLVQDVIYPVLDVLGIDQRVLSRNKRLVPMDRRSNVIPGNTNKQ